MKKLYQYACLAIIILIAICGIFLINGQLTKSDDRIKDTAEFFRSDAFTLVLNTIVYKDDVEKYPVELDSIQLNTAWGNMTAGALIKMCNLSFSDENLELNNLRKVGREVGSIPIKYIGRNADSDQVGNGIDIIEEFIQKMAKRAGFKGPILTKYIDADTGECIVFTTPIPPGHQYVSE